MTFDRLFKNFNIAPMNLRNALRGPSWLCQYSSYDPISDILVCLMHVLLNFTKNIVKDSECITVMHA